MILYHLSMIANSCTISYHYLHRVMYHWTIYHVIISFIIPKKHVKDWFLAIYCRKLVNLLNCSNFFSWMKKYREVSLLSSFRNALTEASTDSLNQFQVFGLQNVSKNSWKLGVTICLSWIWCDKPESLNFKFSNFR